MGAPQVKVDDLRDVKMRISPDINAEVPEDKNCFLFDSNSGRVYSLNRPASFIFRKIKERLPISEVVKQLVSRYDVDSGIATSDIQDFLYQLKEFNITREE
jgi:hypothetical protein